MTITVYISQDTTAVAVGAERVTTAFFQAAREAELPFTLVRNGSRGAFGLEPLIEIETAAQGRVAFGPVSVADVPSLVTAITDGEYERHSNYLGSVNAIPWLANQTRITFKRCGEGDPTDLANYRALGGYRGLERALTLSPQAIVDEIKVSGLRGRGGAAFPTGIKWQTVLDAQGEQKYIVCNADEGDSGTFADRLLMEADPYQLIEGMTISGLAVGATKGLFICDRISPRTENAGASDRCCSSGGYLGADLCGSGQRFELEVEWVPVPTFAVRRLPCLIASRENVGL